MFKRMVEKCRSYRRFDESFRIKNRTLEELVELARCAPSARNQQALKFILSNDQEKNASIFPSLRWAGALKDWGGPQEGERPAAYIIILGDKEISEDLLCDHAIAAYGILLGAVEKGLGGCMVASIDRDLLRKTLKIPDNYAILLVVAIGKPSEKVVLDEIEKGAGTNYYRDKKDVHHVPKRKLKDLIINSQL